MKRKHTEAKKARRASGFQKAHGKSVSANRILSRQDLQPFEPKTKGLQVVRVQRIFFAKDQFGNKRFKLVPHAPAATVAAS